MEFYHTNCGDFLVLQLRASSVKEGVLFSHSPLDLSALHDARYLVNIPDVYERVRIRTCVAPIRL